MMLLMLRTGLAPLRLHGSPNLGIT